jgi:hypothetical protein
MIIKPSKRNTNKHTDKGMQLLETSIDKVGVIESISVTQEGTIISGHARKEIFDKKGMVAKEIKLAENEYPVIVTEIEDNTKEYFEAQILANTTANKNFNLDIEVIEVIAEEYDIEIEEVGVEIEKVENDTMTNNELYEGLDQASKLDKFLEAEIKRMFFVYENETFENVIEKLNAIQIKYNLENHSQVLLKLLEL